MPKNKNKTMENIQLVVLCGGFGTRLKSVIGDTPKTLANINGEPFLKHLIESWINQGVYSFVFLLHYKADAIIAYIQKEFVDKHFTLTFSFLIEPVPYGTAGAIGYALTQNVLNDEFMVANADTWIADGITELRSVAPNTVLIKRSKNTERFGKVSIADDGLVTSFGAEKDGNDEYIYTGLAKLNRDIFSLWSGTMESLEGDVYPRLCRNKQLRATITDGNFTDIGVPEDYYRFCEERVKKNA